MITTKELLKLSKYEDLILDLIESSQDLTTSDLQGVVMAIVKNIYNHNDILSSIKGGD